LIQIKYCSFVFDLSEFISDFLAKQMAALWIKKLCEISDTTNVNVKKIRNAYSQRLLSNLETNEQLLYPFNQKPPSGFLEVKAYFLKFFNFII
jgi:hypothetical protein